MKMIVGNKFQPKLIISIFWIKFAQKRYSQSKTEINITITIEFCMLELVHVTTVTRNV